MARKATVWWWKAKGYWVTELGGRRICLAKGWRNKQAAKDKFKQLSKERDLLAEANGAITVAALCEKFLDDAAENLALKDEGFDVVLSLFALTHFPDPLKALCEMQRVLRPGGMLVVAAAMMAPVGS